MPISRNRWRCLWPTSGSSGKRSNGMPMPTGKSSAGSQRRTTWCTSSIRQQIREEPNPRDFAAELFAECKRSSSKIVILTICFRAGSPSLGTRTATERTLRPPCSGTDTESLCLVPGLPMLWCAYRKVPSWTIEAHLGHNVERAELFGTMAVRDEGQYLQGSSLVKRILKQSSGRATILVRPHELSLKIGRTVTVLA